MGTDDLDILTQGYWVAGAPKSLSQEESQEDKPSLPYSEPVRLRLLETPDGWSSLRGAVVNESD